MDVSCANCGKGEEDRNILKSCTSCKMVKYCNRECQIAHRPHHKKACRKRAKELHDEALFTQPPPLYGDCPICMIPIPSMESGRKYMPCCGKVVCSGCNFALLKEVTMKEIENSLETGEGELSCAFCRTQEVSSDGEVVGMYKKRMALDDAYAIDIMGCFYYHGQHGLPQDHARALELWHQAAALGHAPSHYSIAHAYEVGEGVERDAKKTKHYYELSAMGGCTDARHNLGRIESQEASAKNRVLGKANALTFDRAVKHFLIAARGGQKDSLDTLRHYYSTGYATKESYTNALHAYQSYLDEIKSPLRDEAVVVLGDDHKYYGET
jgi:TPR repeat protein